jgi:hypothetical protein
MQPVSWLVIGLLVMFAGLAGLTISNRRERAAGQVGQPMSTMAVAMVGVSQEQATRTPRPSATPRPTRTLRPTADATAAFFKRLDARQTAAVRTATAEARATQAIATFTPEPPTPTIYPVGYRAPWADKMVKQADGTWMAPKEVVEQVTKHYEEYYAWLLARDVDSALKSPEQQLKQYARYLAGVRLVQQAAFVRGGRNLLRSPEAKPFVRILRVKSFSSDGLTVLCDTDFRGFRWRVYDTAIRGFESEYSEADSIDSDRLNFDPSDGRWKLVEGSIAVVPLTTHK